MSDDLSDQFEAEVERVRALLAAGEVHEARVGLVRTALDMAIRIDPDDHAERADWVRAARQVLEPPAPRPPFVVPPELKAVLDALREEGRHPLVAAAREGDDATVAALLPDTLGEERTTALEEAAAAGRASCVTLLLDAGVAVPGAALQRALYAHQRAVFRQLLDARPPIASLAAALSSALLDDDEEAVEMLLAAGLPERLAREGAETLGSAEMRARIIRIRGRG